MAITKLQPFNINSNGNYTFQNANVTGNVTANYFIGNGSQLSGIDATTIQNGTANVRTFNNANVAISAAGNSNIVIVTGTGVNVAGTLNTTGNVSITDNINVGGPLASVWGANKTISVNVASGGSEVAVVDGAYQLGLIADSGLQEVGLYSSGSYDLSLYWNGYKSFAITGGDVYIQNRILNRNGTAAALDLGGGTSIYYNDTHRFRNLAQTANIFTANTSIAQFFGNIGANGNITGQVLISNIATGTAPFTVTSTTQVANLNVATAGTAGTVTTASQPNITSVGTLTGLGVNGTLTAVNITANTGVFTGNGNGLSSLQASNISGTVASATAATNASALLQNTSTSTTVYPTFTTSSSNGNSSAVFNTSISANLGNASITATTFVGTLSGAATSATTAGTVTTASQPNITSVGTLTGLTSNGTINFTNASNVSLGSNSNVKITGGTNTQVLSTDGTGNLSWVSVSSSGISNGTSNVTIPFANDIVYVYAGGTEAARFDAASSSINGLLSVGNDLTMGTNANISISGTGALDTPLIRNGNSNITLAANSSISLYVAGNGTARVVATSTGANIAGNLVVTGNIANTRINTRTSNNGGTTSGSITPNADTSDQFDLIGINGTANIQIPSGSFLNGQKLLLRIKDNGVSQTLNWVTVGANSYRAVGVILPTATTAGKVTYVGCVYNSQDVFWDTIAVITQG